MGWQGKLDLTYDRREEKTTLAESRVQAPLKVQRSFYPEGESVCHTVVLHTAGGIVGGDRLVQNIRLQPHAQVLATTAAASKIYRSNGLQARQTVRIDIEEGAVLEWLPQETIVFNEAIYRQDLQIELAPKASWMGWEIVRFGRTARGERFVSGEWRSNLEVWRDGVPLWIDRQYFPASETRFESPHGLGGNPVVGTLAWVGEPVSAERVEKARSWWQGSGAMGVTRLQEGLLCRYRGRSTQDVRNWFTTVWHDVRSSVWGREACVPRVWRL
ncbi:MAG TPA: urease accessory protein UreD [Oscillatoriales cyanobacterium M59_W2019_021]|nr:MAG: urease accessory protein UreD [Cyanobacteria bacterium J055]HIK30975.1 urease accessory protein UreD [Oscillatoriales cyanobacterium M4454_W2019_049]HIK50855.1 urease accessory protein UreD [Oscillatoriales cyanobacterium M59_W2019_021]